MERGRLNKYFHSREFECKCGCGLFNLDPTFFEKLTKTRESAGVPFVINSGCRCSSHNYIVGGTKQSGHLTGKACDIKAHTLAVMTAILRGAFLREMDGIGIGPNFIHLDMKGRKLITCYEPFTRTFSRVRYG